MQALNLSAFDAPPKRVRPLPFPKNGRGLITALLSKDTHSLEHEKVMS
jgi:hypothetical protein